MFISFGIIVKVKNQAYIKQNEGICKGMSENQPHKGSRNHFITSQPLKNLLFLSSPNTQNTGESCQRPL